MMSRPLSKSDKALRKARIDDFCARNGIQSDGRVYLPIGDALASKQPNGARISRQTVRSRRIPAPTPRPDLSDQLTELDWITPRALLRSKKP